jgi:hypothetical protein
MCLVLAIQGINLPSGRESHVNAYHFSLWEHEVEKTAWERAEQQLGTTAEWSDKHRLAKRIMEDKSFICEALGQKFNIEFPSPGEG